MKPLDLDDVEYLVTLEDLDKIVQGLEMRPGLDSLAICGSGDVPFALAEFGNVLAVDKDLYQIRYFQMRRDLLLAEKDFLPLAAVQSENYSHVQRYFSDPGRLDVIRRNASQIQVRRRDLFKLISLQIFHRIYLSNILGFSRNISDREKFNFANRLVDRMPFGGVICLAGRENFEGLNVKGLSLVDQRKLLVHTDCAFNFGYFFYRVAPKNL